jgi:hypothetical protein
LYDQDSYLIEGMFTVSSVAAELENEKANRAHAARK